MSNRSGLFEGHCALITGASTGIGRGIAEAFLAQGGSVVNLSRRELAIEHDKLTSYACDLSDPASCRETAAEGMDFTRAVQHIREVDAREHIHGGGHQHPGPGQ